MEFGIQDRRLADKTADNALYIDQVYQRLLTAIALGELKPGERVRQAVLAERLSVSRQPISHALQLLKHEGLVRDAGRQGVEVTPIDPDYMWHLYQARKALETMATSLACERVRSGAATPQEIEGLRAALKAGQTLCKQDAALAQMVQADFAFHQALYRLAGNPAIEQMMLGRWPHLMRSMLAVLDDPGVPTRAWEEHEAILQEVLDGSPTLAVEIASKHMQRAQTDMHRRLCSHPAITP